MGKSTERGAKEVCTRLSRFRNRIDVRERFPQRNTTQKSDSLKEIQPKMDEWMENGCRLAWLIHPKERKTFVYQENGTISEIPFETPLSGKNILPGFQLDLTTIFDKQ